MSVRVAILEAAEALSATSDTPRLDAELMMAALLQTSRSDMLLRRMADEVPSGWGHLVRRRMEHEPVAYILGEAEFRGLTLEVSPAVLIPRGDSETVVEAALEAKPDARRVLDCGTGSGALLLALLAALHEAQGIGIDRSEAAVSVAQANAEATGLGDRALLMVADWTAPGWAAELGTFDLIVANPPYVEADAALDPDVREHEPAGALFAGTDGLDDYRILVPQLPALLEKKGIAVLEIGHEQAESVGRIASDAGFTSELRRDLGGRPRALILRQI
ncbi:Release factor glutamine methyltransferase [Tsuneonella dongtanensis]|uniref:Release factor glutamine methyltransferase n=1 Tax=Tsuneonella dongtanensis TaxID=692370 RepID=A0A1B2A996_9SPHN|nr:peptide chain release factor N(5)-glutamine methyltransferase [Tsuneonella dongtanensis]ANY18737.1 Release factor glutamine methyltransferase [Tsuneonella dongtanensis]